MIQEVKAWKSSDGQVHENKLKASEADALHTLSGLEAFNEANRIALIKHAEEVVKALQPYVQVLAEQAAKPAKRNG